MPGASGRAWRPEPPEGVLEDLEREVDHRTRMEAQPPLAALLRSRGNAVPNLTQENTHVLEVGAFGHTASMAPTALFEEEAGPQIIQRLVSPLMSDLRTQLERAGRGVAVVGQSEIRDLEPAGLWNGYEVERQSVVGNPSALRRHDNLAPPLDAALVCVAGAAGTDRSRRWTFEYSASRRS